MITPLNHTTAPSAARPIRVLQFGDGNFLRAFTDWIIDISNEKGVTDLGIAVVPPRFRKNAAIDTLMRQDGLFHVVLEGIENGAPQRSSRLITSVAEAFAPEEDYEKYRSVILSPDLRFVVSNTTEAGIRYEPDDVLSHIPATFPGKVTNMLYQRYVHFDGDPDKGLIFLCCELIEDNGTMLRRHVLRHAKEAGLPQGFVSWVENACIFCDTLVDRIVPGFPSDSIDSVKAEIGYDDNAVTVGELYHLWVIGGKDWEKVQAELPLHKSGLHVVFTPSIKEFRDKKVRILNGSHTGMVAMGILAGCHTVIDAFSNPQIRTFVDAMVQREVLPVIDGDRAELHRFASGILERFLNPYLKHNLASIALNSLSKWEARNFPTLKDFYNRTGKVAPFETFTFAALMALYAPGSDFAPSDNAEHLAPIAKAWEKGDEEAALSGILSSGIFLADFEDEVPGFTKEAAKWLAQIRTLGIHTALDNFIKANEA